MLAHPTRPIIGINADFVAAGKLATAHARLDAGYVDAGRNAGGVPVIIPPAGTAAELDGLLDRLDGVVLSGGLDLEPRRGGLPANPAGQSVAERRELSDRLLVRGLLARRLPVLAIGLGMHELNVACGGSLYPHLPEDQPQALPHSDRADGPRRHAVLLEPHTRIEEIYGGGEVRVNSGHHQGVRQVGAPLRISARATDGIIEAIEAVDPGWFCVGVQWRPESDAASARDSRLFECFVRACLRPSRPLPLAA